MQIYVFEESSRGFRALFGLHYFLWTLAQSRTYIYRRIKTNNIAKEYYMAEKCIQRGAICMRSATFSIEELKTVAMQPDFVKTCTRFPPSTDQAGLNLLVFESGVEITNLTLPPLCMESTWAGDYPAELFEYYWADPQRKPYLIHWAGIPMDVSRPINQIFYNFLTQAEKLSGMSRLGSGVCHTEKQPLWAGVRSSI
jgi:hypothetical protein